MSRSFRGPVRRVPGKFDKSKSVEIFLTDMGMLDAVWWDARYGSKHALLPRADRFWVWSSLLPMCHLVQLAKRRDCRALVIWARRDDGRLLRVGMSILIESYPYLDASRSLESTFAWFISAADPEMLRQKEFGMSDPPALGRALLDIAIVLSQNLGLEGRIGLHAAAAGGQSLLDFYVMCGLSRLPMSAKLPSEVKRNNDGRFFLADEAQAEALAAMLDPAR